MSEGQTLEPFGCECASGKYIVVQARNQTEAIMKVRNEYKEEVSSCRKV